MMLVVFLLPTLALAKITISVDMSTRRDEVKVSLHGEERNRITSDEIEKFDVLYFTQGEDMVMHEVHTFRKAVNATILSLQSKPTVLAHNILDNSEGRDTAEFRADVMQSVTNTYTNTWHNSHGIQVGAEVSMEFNFLVQKGGAKASFSYNHQWGKSGSVSQTVTVGSSAGITVPVAPGNSLEATITASRGICEIEIHYVSYVCDYFFPDWTCDKERNGVSNIDELHDTEIIKVDFFTDVHTVLRGIPGNNTKGLK